MSDRVKELQQFREREGRRRNFGRALTLEEAAALVVVDGQSPNRTTWHAWETRRKVPAAKFMPVLCDLVGVSADVFYPRKRACGQPKTAADGQLMLV